MHMDEKQAVIAGDMTRRQCDRYLMVATELQRLMPGCCSFTRIVRIWMLRAVNRISDHHSMVFSIIVRLAGDGARLAVHVESTL
jgi:hypothetical protein